MKVRITLLVCSIVVAAALAEVGIRFWSPIPSERLLPFAYNAQRVTRIADDDTYIRFDRDLGWGLAPSHTRRDDGRVYRTNSQAMRADREYALETPTGRQRIAAFGDSFTHCSEVTQRDCWVPRLEESWLGTEVLNFGVTAYGPDQAWLRYQRDGRPYQPCAVLIGYFVEDIDRVVNRFRPFIHPDDSVMLSKPRFLLDGDGLALLPNPTTDPLELADPDHVERTLGAHDAWYFPGTFVAGPLDKLEIVRIARTAAYRQARASLVRSDDRYPLYEQQGEAFQVTGRILIQFAEQVRANGATPVVIVFPGERDLLDEQKGQPPYWPLVTWLGRAGVITLDLMDVMAEEVEQQGIDQLFVERHYSSVGNRIVAKHLAQTLPPLVSSTCQQS
jgi:hypothetical protein